MCLVKRISSDAGSVRDAVFIRDFDIPTTETVNEINEWMRIPCFMDCALIAARDAGTSLEQPGTVYFPSTMTELPVGWWVCLYGKSESIFSALFNTPGGNYVMVEISTLCWCKMFTQRNQCMSMCFITLFRDMLYNVLNVIRRRRLVLRGCYSWWECEWSSLPEEFQFESRMWIHWPACFV